MLPRWSMKRVALFQSPRKLHGPAAALGQMLASEREIWASVIAETGIKPL